MTAKKPHGNGKVIRDPVKAFPKGATVKINNPHHKGALATVTGHGTWHYLTVRLEKSGKIAQLGPAHLTLVK